MMLSLLLALVLQAPVVPILVPADPLNVSVKDAAFGAVGDNVTDDTAAIQRAIDSVSAVVIQSAVTHDGFYDKGTVRIPSSWYKLTSPLYLDTPHVSIVGEGDRSTLNQTGGHACINVATPRVEKGGKIIDGSYRPGGNSISTVGAFGPAYVRFIGTRLDLGGPDPLANNPLTYDHYGANQKLTLDILIQRPVGVTWTPGQPLLGVGNATPYSLMVDNEFPGQLAFNFRTPNQAVGDNPYLIRFPVPDPGQPLNLVIQIDLNAGKFWVFANGVSVTPQINGWDTTKPTNFTCNQGKSAFMIGCADDFGPIWETNPTMVTPLILSGLMVTSGLKYADVPVGGPLMRVDNRQIPDNNYQFHNTSTPGCLGSLEPSWVVGDQRLVSCAQFSGMFVHVNSLGGQTDNSVENLRLSGTVSSQGLALGAVLNFHARNVKNIGCARGITNMNVGANYTLYLDDCILQGVDTALYLSSSDLVSKNLVCFQGGVDTIRLYGSSGSFRDTRVLFQGARQRRLFSFLSGGYGGGLNIDGFTADWEGGGATESMFRLEQYAYSPVQATISNVGFGTTGAVPLFLLYQFSDDTTNVFRQSTLDLSSVNVMADGYTAAVQTNGPTWVGRAYLPALSRQLINVDPLNRPSNIIVSPSASPSPNPNPNPSPTPGPAVLTTPALLPQDDSGTKGDNVTNVKNPRVTGSATNSTAIDIALSGGNVLGQAQVINNAYTVGVSNPLGDGTYPLNAVSGTVKSPTLTLKIATSPPGAPSAPVLPPVYGANNVSKVAWPMLTGILPVKETGTLQLIDNTGAVLGTAKANGSGTYTIRTASPLKNGNYALRANVIDYVGNTSPFSPILNLTVNVK